MSILLNHSCAFRLVMKWTYKWKLFVTPNGGLCVFFFQIQFKFKRIRSTRMRWYSCLMSFGTCGIIHCTIELVEMVYICKDQQCKRVRFYERFILVNLLPAGYEDDEIHDHRVTRAKCIHIEEWCALSVKRGYSGAVYGCWKVYEYLNNTFFLLG